MALVVERELVHKAVSLTEHGSKERLVNIGYFHCSSDKLPLGIFCKLENLLFGCLLVGFKTFNLAVEFDRSRIVWVLLEYIFNVLLNSQTVDLILSPYVLEPGSTPEIFESLLKPAYITKGPSCQSSELVACSLEDLLALMDCLKG